MISRSGLGNYLFNWNEVPGKDNDRFEKWLENRGVKEPGDKLDIRKTALRTLVWKDKIKISFQRYLSTMKS